MAHLKKILYGIIAAGIAFAPFVFLNTDPLGILIFLYLITVTPIIIICGFSIFFMRNNSAPAQDISRRPTFLLRIVKFGTAIGALVIMLFCLGWWALVFESF